MGEMRSKWITDINLRVKFVPYDVHVHIGMSEMVKTRMERKMKEKKSIFCAHNWMKKFQNIHIFFSLFSFLFLEFTIQWNEYGIRPAGWIRKNTWYAPNWLVTGLKFLPKAEKKESHLIDMQKKKKNLNAFYEEG